MLLILNSNLFSEPFNIGIELNVDEKLGINSGHCSDYFDFGLSLESNSSSTPADWWLVQQNGQKKLLSYELESSSFKEGIATSYQGNLFSFNNMNLTGTCHLDAGLNIFYFGIDSKQNGVLDFDTLNYDSYPIKVAGSGTRQERLNNTFSWMYQIQNLDDDKAIQNLAETKYPMLVIEPGHNFLDFSYNTTEIVSKLKDNPDGGTERLLLAYIDIGQAEDYRDYWQSDWTAPTASQRGNPDFMLTIDPDGWSGNYPVAYWRQEWKELWLGDNGIIVELAKLGFDGVYLDWVEAYDDDTVRIVAEEENVNPEVEMIKFIEEIKQSGQTIISDFLVISQNAPYLIDTDKSRYLATIDALAVEDTWFHGAGDANWDDPDAGDLHQRHDGEWSTTNRLKQYKQYQRSGLPVFSVDYCISTQNAEQVYNDAAKEGLRPLVTRVSLSRLTVTPPDF